MPPMLTNAHAQPLEDQTTLGRALSVSFIIGVLNERRRLPRVLESIRRQHYSADRIEIIVVDGGSEDATVDYARDAGCRVLNNPLRRCEPGIARGVAAASGEIAIVLAADNELVDQDFLTAILRPFEDTAIIAAIPRIISIPSDPLTTKYMNTFTDPFNHFLYGAATSPLTFGRVYPVRKRGLDYIVYDFARGEPPLVAFAQGFALRTTFRRPAGTEEDDVAPVTAIIESGGLVAIAPSARIAHHSVTGLSDFVRKFRPRIAARLRDRSAPIWRRGIAWSAGRRFRAYAWPIYAISVAAPLLYALFGVIRDREPLWLAHPALSFVLGVVFWQEGARYVLSRLRSARR